MSKSYRKNPISKDGGTSSKKKKKIMHKTVRRKLNRDISDDSLANIPSKKMYETWDINDYISRYTREDAIAYYNKTEKDEWQKEWFYKKYPTLEDWLNEWEKNYIRK